ncbi:MAG: hypothetical protein Fur0037_29290 [Planctomycetota bacterium]
MPAARAAVIATLKDGAFRLLGEDLAGTRPLRGAREFLLDASRMRGLVQSLRENRIEEAAGRAHAAGLPLPRSIEIRLPSSRLLAAAPGQRDPGFERLVAVVERVLDEEAWQLFRDPEAEPDRGAFWRAESRWRAEHQDRLERSRRLLQRVVRRWPGLGEDLRALAVRHLFPLVPEGLVREADGEAIVAMLRSLPSLGEHDARLLEMAVSAPGDAVWRHAVDLAATMPGADRNQVSRIFSLLGADSVLRALSDSRPVVRQSAVGEIARTKDLRAAADLVRLLDDPDSSVRQSAAFACGALGLDGARPRLLALIVAEGTDSGLRREALRAVGRIGGPGAFDVLQRALAAPALEDRLAALRGIGELRDSRAADLLAELFVASLGSATGDLAKFYLQQMGAALAVPALRAQLRVGDPVARDAVVDLLAGYQDPVVLPDLIDRLRQGRDPLRALAAVGAITGLDVSAQGDRVRALEDWSEVHGKEPQWQWLLQALARENIPSTLEAEQFAEAAGLSAVPELARLLVEADGGRIRALCAAVLRTLTGKDHGIVNEMTPRETLEAIAARYRAMFDAARAAKNR